jgi:CBS-domain-containing membrane protein
MEEDYAEDIPYGLNISDDDVFEAMRDIPGFLDITPGDFKELYRRAYRHAVTRITSRVRARDLMTRDVFSVGRDTPLREVAELLAERGVAGVPVLDAEGRVEGVISEKDFLSRMGGEGARSFMGVVAECLRGKGCVAVSVRAQRAGDIMSSPAVTVGEETTVMAIADIFTGKGINRVPVVDGAGKLLGIVSRADIVRARGLAGGQARAW